jgi:hypothetical protein
MWFRYYFKNHIAEQMSELESNEGLLQLDNAPERGGLGDSSLQGGFSETIQAHGDGNCLNATGKFRFMADRNLMDTPLDLSVLNQDRYYSLKNVSIFLALSCFSIFVVQVAIGSA